MTEQTYNGWTNYATWGVALVLGNDEGTYNESRDRARELKDDAPNHRNVPEIWTAEQAAKFELVDWLKDYVEELCGVGSREMDEISPSMMAHQVISAGLADVDWDEIAANILSELDES
jgi:hypothetical protein